MEITVALDGAKRRDLRVYEGDQITLTVKVFRKDTDEEPINPALVTDLTISTVGPFDGTVPVGTPFTIPGGLVWRNWYTLRGTVDGVSTTLAYGWFLGYGMPERTVPWGNDYGWRWPFGPGNWGVLP